MKKTAKVLGVSSAILYFINAVFWAYIFFTSFLLAISKIDINENVYSVSYKLSFSTVILLFYPLCAVSMIISSLFFLFKIFSNRLNKLYFNIFIIIWIIVNYLWFILIPPQSYLIALYSFIRFKFNMQVLPIYPSALLVVSSILIISFCAYELIIKNEHKIQSIEK